jgi:hypothetical protein
MSVRNSFFTVAATALGSAVGAGAAGPAAAPDDEELFAVVLEHAARTTATAAVAASLTTVLLTPRPKRLGLPVGIEVSSEGERVLGVPRPDRVAADVVCCCWIFSEL